MRRFALLSALLCCAVGAGAQTPLERRITVHVRDVALRDALDRVAVLGGFRMAYSGDNLPLDRRVTVWRDQSAVRDILDDLLRGYAVTPVVVTGDQVVLTPRVA